MPNIVGHAMPPCYMNSFVAMCAASMGKYIEAVMQVVGLVMAKALCGLQLGRHGLAHPESNNPCSVVPHKGVLGERACLGL